MDSSNNLSINLQTHTKNFNSTWLAVQRSSPYCWFITTSLKQCPYQVLAQEEMFKFPSSPCHSYFLIPLSGPQSPLSPFPGWKVPAYLSLPYTEAIPYLLWASSTSTTAFLKFRDHKCTQYSRCGRKIYSDILMSCSLLINLTFGLLFDHYWAYNGCSHQCITAPRPCSLLVMVSSESVILSAALPCVYHFRSFKIISSRLSIKSLSLIRSCSGVIH